jgi:hypothetical protein
VGERVLAFAGKRLEAREVVQEHRIVAVLSELRAQERGSFGVLARLVEGRCAAERVPDLVDPEQPSELDNRLPMILDAQLADAVDALARLGRGARPLDDHRRGLLAARVAAGRLRRLQRRDQPLR